MNDSVQSDKGGFVAEAISYRDHTIVPDVIPRGDGTFDARYTILNHDVHAEVSGPFPTGKAAEQVAIAAAKVAVDALVPPEPRL